MKPGRGKNKGSAFERKVCAALSLWVTNGEKKDVFWRSAMSGGRATVTRKKGQAIRQAGDICAVAQEGHVLTNYLYIECKHIKNLRLSLFLLSGGGPLALFWRKAQREAAAHDRTPVLIAKQNNLPTIVIASSGTFDTVPCADLRGGVSIYAFDEILQAPFHEPGERDGPVNP